MILNINSCSRKSNNPQLISGSVAGVPQDSIFNLCSNWRADSTGCLHLRTDKNAKIIGEELKNKVVDLQKLYMEIGHPNEISMLQDSEKIIYYFNSVCINNQLTDSTELCWLEILYNPKTKEISNYNLKCM